ncbi:alpha/beta fold hydrolase [Micromonospora rifamycinica]|uniref:Pimeloyl-ACP methyl ester carboxylesterase n=1 Tax=Micromonospora rifamycinica TaxID=291594 RepID=A0A1C5J347_9ACTN|nr:alpha/beta hydrolase [Micromonospora rifamycinica]SCG65010.1 Pimeloyl-ACP methyl ester carboxylesterase [Micromonospora rifamycinica]
MTTESGQARLTGTAVSPHAGRPGGIHIAYESLGRPDGEPLLLVMGLGMQMIMWHDDLCAAFAGRGFTVARFDHRDVGASTHLHEAGRPTILRMMLRPGRAAYRLPDMAGDAVAVLDALGWPRAHVVGISLGGMIAQQIAIDHPGRVLSLTSISATASPRIGRLSMRTAMRLQKLQDRPVENGEQAGQLMVDLFDLIGSPGYDMDERWLRERGRIAFDRAYDQAGRLRHEAALMASRDRRAQLAELRVPALVVHGEADRIWNVAGGRATAEAIPGARLMTFPGYGHGVLPRALWADVVGGVAALAGR